MTENDSKNITVEEFLKTTVKVSQSVFYRFVFVTSGGVFVGDWFLEKNVSLDSTVTIHNVVFTNNAGEKSESQFLLAVCERHHCCCSDFSRAA